MKVSVSERDIFKLMVKNKSHNYNATFLTLVKETFSLNEPLSDAEKRLLFNSVRKFKRAKDNFTKKCLKIDFDSILEEGDASFFLIERENEGEISPGRKKKHWLEAKRKTHIQRSKESNIENLIREFSQKEDIDPSVYVEYLLTRFPKAKVSLFLLI